ncbi:Asd/ArgC dimerization domain-containing protein [Litorivivens sp.]|uniref:Asd/ArgC dimerization domain-containing protein n=1 Tax=Litorivivens sp. TaxID=2020868 RepID=UPI003565BE1A
MRLAICGTEGPIADGFLEQLETAGVSVTALAAFATEPAEDASFRYDGKTVRVQPLADADYTEFDLLVVFELLEALSDVADAANSAGCHLIDVVGQGASDGRVVVPELMGDERVDYPVFWTLPSPVVSALAPVLGGLLEGNRISSLSALVCESASSLGESGTRQLAAETARLMNGQGIEGDGVQLAFNLIPGIPQNADYCVRSLEDLLGTQFERASVESLQVPLFYGQTIQLKVALEADFQLSHALELWRKSGIHLVENNKKFSPVSLAEDDRIHLLPMPAQDAANRTVSLWVLADNVRKGAVVNTIKLMEILIKSSI